MSLQPNLTFSQHARSRLTGVAARLLLQRIIKGGGNPCTRSGTPGLLKARAAADEATAKAMGLTLLERAFSPRQLMEQNMKPTGQFFISWPGCLIDHGVFMFHEKDAAMAPAALVTRPYLHWVESEDGLFDCAGYLYHDIDQFHERIKTLDTGAMVVCANPISACSSWETTRTITLAITIPELAAQWGWQPLESWADCLLYLADTEMAVGEIMQRAAEWLEETWERSAVLQRRVTTLPKYVRQPQAAWNATPRTLGWA